jgi:riboflavin synthase
LDKQKLRCVKVFTGLIEELGVLQQTIRGAGSAWLKIKAQQIIKDMQQGDSIAVNGACLTVTKAEKDSFTADVMAETLARTNLGQLAPGDRVNLERAVRLGDRLGGHLVSGHIDGAGTIKSQKKYDIAVVFDITAPVEVMRYIIKKGSVAVDGISLTVVDFNAHSFQVSIIPHTAQVTTLGWKGPGDTVNLETDIIGKYVERFLTGRQATEEEKKGLSMTYLAEHGFL